TSHINPFLPSAISTVSVLFFFSTDHCIGVTGDISRGRLTIWKFGHCPRALGQ
ncbi:unnamed protein product, partial [Staurois parvus]